MTESLCAALQQYPPPRGESSRPTSTINCRNELNREFRVWIRRSLLYLRGRWSGWRGRQRWCACVAGAGWGFGHRGSFSKDRLAWCLRDGIEPAWASRQVLLCWVFFPCSWSSFWWTWLFASSVESLLNVQNARTSTLSKRTL